MTLKIKCFELRNLYKKSQHFVVDLKKKWGVILKLKV